MPKYTVTMRHLSPPREGGDAYSLGEITADNAEQAHRAVQQKLRSENVLVAYIGDIQRGGGKWKGVGGTVELRLAS